MANTDEQYAGFWVRFVAIFFDCVIIGLAQSFLIIPLLGLLGFREIGRKGLENIQNKDLFGLLATMISNSSELFFITIIIGWLYFSLLQSSYKQATFGKLIFGLKVIDQNGGRLSFSKASLRYLAKLLSFLIMTIGYIMAAFTDRKQGLQDIIANTYVIKIKSD